MRTIVFIALALGFFAVAGIDSQGAALTAADWLLCAAGTACGWIAFAD